MKILIIFIFIITNLFFFSCENDGEITIKASLPIRTNNSNENLNNIDINKLPDFTNFYIPNALLEQFDDDNVSVKLHVITPTKQHKEFNIIAPQSQIIKNKNLKKVLDISFNALLEEGKKRILLVQIGSPLDKIVKNNDINTNLMFTGGKLIDVKKGKDYDPIELKPVVNIKGNVFLGSNNKKVGAEVTAYPAYINDKLQYSLKLTKSTNSNGFFNLSSIYGIFQVKYREIHKKEYFNLLLTAIQGDKIGFSIVGKEYQEFENIKNHTNIEKEYSCYKYYKEEGSKMCGSEVTLNCNNIFNSNCFTTQSGNLLPGVNIVSDIKIYSKEDIEKIPNGIAVTSISSPKFAKKESLDGAPYNEAYYGNFFIAGFNLDKLIKSNDKTIKPPEGTIRIYYKVNSELYDEFYLEYVGPFSLYNLENLAPKALRGKNAQVIQNRLPFFKLYAFPKGLEEGVSLPSTYIPEGLNLTDGFNIKDTFLGINGLKKLTDNYKITRVEISNQLDTEDFFSNCKTIYNTSTKKYCKIEYK